MMNGAIDISLTSLALGYLLLLIPVAIVLILRLNLLSSIAISVLRMSIQLLFVALYLQIVFDLNLWWLNTLWFVSMVLVADLSVAGRAGLKPRRFVLPLFAGMLIGSGIPLFYFLAVILRIPYLFDAKYMIPIAGMLLGNSLRANIIGLNGFYSSLKTNERAYLMALSQGATVFEAARPYFKDAYRAAIMPTIANMSTIGLVSLPGMMTGIILGGTDPATAIKYQIAIMLAIFAATTLSVLLGILLALNVGFNSFGVLDKSIFKANGK